jgi:pimeloyl-ACP methyl ester carboxylesterase
MMEEMRSLQRTFDGLAYEDGVLTLADGRDLAWRWLGDAGTPILRFQGTPGSRLVRNPDPRIQQELKVRYLMADRPGYGGSTRKPGRGVADFADDIRALLDAHGLDRVPAMGTSGGGPHVLAVAAKLPERISAVTVVVGAAPLVAEEAAGLVGVNAEGYILAEQGWAPLHELLVRVRERLLSPEGMAGVLHDAPAADRAIMQDPAWQRMSREANAEALRLGAEGWTDESMALHSDWDFDLADVRASVTWWHGDDDKNAPITAARRALAGLPNAGLRTWHGEGHFASLLHEREIVQELLSRTTTV